MSWQDFPVASPEMAPAPQATTPSDWQNFQEAPAEQPPAPKQTAVSATPNTNQIANWMTFGLANKAAALGSAVGAVLPGSANPGGFWDTYSDKLDKMRQETKAFTEAHPYENIAGSLIGGAMGAPPMLGAKLATGLGSAMTNAAKGGAAVGAAAGAGAADTGKELQGASEGAVAGGAFGAAVPPLANMTKPLLEGFAQLTPSLFPQAAWNAALNRIAQRAQQSQAAGGPGPLEMAQNLVPGKPMGLVDVGGAPVQGLAGTVARTPGEATETARNFFTSRDANAGSRLIADIDANISSGIAAPDAVAQLFRQRAAAAAPLYRQAFSGPPVTSPELQRLLTNPFSGPLLQQGLQNGIKIQGLEAAATGAQYPPPGGFGPTTDMRTLDAAKRGLDDIIEQYRDPTTGHLNLNQEGRAINQVKQAYVQELDNLNPDYAAARAAWSGPSDSMGLIRQGQGFETTRPEDIAREVAQMAPNQRDMYLLGVADKLRTNVQQTAINGDEAKKLVNNQYVQNQLRPLFQNQQDYDGFIRSVMAERSMFDIKTPIIGGSQTASRIAEAAAQNNEGGGPMMKLAAGALALKGGEPFLGSSMLLRGAKEAYGHLTQPSEATTKAMADILFNQNRAQNMANLGAIASRGPQTSIPPWLLQPGARLFGSIAPNLIGGPTSQ